MKTTILSLFILSMISFAMPTMAMETETHDCAAINGDTGPDTIVRDSSDSSQSDEGADSQ